MKDITETIIFEESVRKRPFMYIGNEGIIGLFKELLTACIELCNTEEITFEIIILGDNQFILGITSQGDINPFLQDYKNKEIINYFPTILKIVSERFEIINKNTSKTEVHFSFDRKIITNTHIDYLELTEKILKFALLNRQCKIITIDKRQKYLNQNYFHFPQGIFYLFNRTTAEVLGKPKFKLTFDGKVNSNNFQIGLAYHTDWYPTPNIISFANNIHTIYGGSLVEGILEGLTNACKTYFKKNNLITSQINRKKLLNGLILVCAVRGEDFKYGGSFKETLEDAVVKRQAKKIITNLALDFFYNQKESSDQFLWRFDTTQLTSGMY